MSTRSSRSSSIPIPRNPAASSARNIESLIPIFGRQPTSPSTSRPLTEQRRISTYDGFRGVTSTSQGASSTSPVRGTARSNSSVGRSLSRTFEPRIIRGSTADGDSECPPNTSISHTHNRRTSLRAPSQRPVIPQHVSRTAPVSSPRPPYLDHSSLRHMLHTELPPQILSRRADPNMSARNQAYANALFTTSETDDDTPGSALSQTSVEYSFKLPTRWSDQDRHPSLLVSHEGRELTLQGQLPALSNCCHAE